ncbi:MAG: YbaK/EbsC family protein [Burkholderiales bacterium]|nr:YbaK/EbsC family protein [Burkholderiales bacterium]
MIATTLENYLRYMQVPFEVLPHPKAMTSLRSASAAHIPAHQMAKAVVLEDETGYVMAVVPADRRVHLGALREQLGRTMGLATEPELGTVFKDCALGAIPPLGAAYGIESVVDDELREGSEIYFEAGDHEEMVRMRREDFLRLLGPARHGHFCRH